MRVNDAETLVVDEMIRDDGKRKSSAASASPSHAPAHRRILAKISAAGGILQALANTCKCLWSNDGVPVKCDKIRPLPVN